MTSSVEAPDIRANSTSGWQRLPTRGALLAAPAGLMLGLPLGTVATVLQTSLWDQEISLWWLIPAALLTGAALGAWLSVRRYQRMQWKLDDSAFAVQRGNLWRSETLVPISRVQHLDLKRGPLERLMGLATLVIHTAGTRQATVQVHSLNLADAEHLRDRLARQVDLDDAL